MAKTGRLEVRVEPELLVRLDERCEVLGQTRSKFVERAVLRALAFEEQSARNWAEEPVVKPKPASRALVQADRVLKMTPAEVRGEVVPGVKTARQVAMERQAALNKAKGS